MLSLHTGDGFQDARDRALIRVLMEPTVRRIDCVMMGVDDVDVGNQTIRLWGRRPHNRRDDLISITNATSVALATYLEVRARHPYAQSPNLWLGLRGPLGGSGIMQIVRRRGLQGGIDRLLPGGLARGASPR